MNKAVDDNPLSVAYRPVDSLVPYINNAKQHEPAQIDQIAASIKEFGFNNPILLDGEHGVIAGHGRLLAAQKLRLEQVPTIELAHLTDTQKRAYILADNRLAEVNSSWDYELVSLELDALNNEGFDIDLTGFDGNAVISEPDDENFPGEKDNYSRIIKTPVYTPKGERPELSELYDTTKTEELISRIESADDIPDQLKDFLVKAAERHTTFNFGKIAEYYCHADPEVKRLMEDSALVVIDFSKAIEDGFVSLTEKLLEQYGIDYPRGGEDVT